MENRSRRKALEGAEEETLDLIADVSTPQQWAELLKAPLKRAIANGNIGLARALVEAGAEIGEALHMAILGGHEEIAKAMLENGAPVDAEDSEGETPLLLAAAEGQSEIVQLLLLKGADKDGCGGGEDFPLCNALRNGHEAAALALVAASAEVDVYIGCIFETPAVCEAATHGQLEILRALIEQGAPVNATDAHGKTALHFAVAKAGSQGAAEIVDILLAGGADETIVTNDGDKAADVIGVAVQEEDRRAEDVERVRQLLLANTPADRAWRRRGYLAMCRTHSGRLHSPPDSIGDWARVMANVLGLHDEGLFRTIVGYL